jgi:hypothetical protein
MSAACEPTWYAHSDWFELLRSCGWVGDQPRLLEVRHQEAMRLPLLCGPKPGHWQGLSNYYTPLLMPVGGTALADPKGLARAWRRAGASILDLRPLDAESSWVAELRAALRSAGYWLAEAPAFGNWVLHVEGQTAEQYLAARPGPLRTSLQRGRARLKRAGELSLEVVLSPGEALERALQDYEAVYAASWKPAEGSAAFIRGLMHWMAARGELRLGVLRLNGEPLAAQIWFVSQGVASIFKLAHVDGKEALSPGTVLTAELMSRVIDVDGVHTVDFISGDDGYKRDWMSERRQRMALLAFDPLTTRGLAGAFRHALRARLSRA